MFYVNPPVDASVESWSAWLKADQKQERKAEKALQKEAGVNSATKPPDLICRKVGGVWKMSSPIAFVGDFETGSGSLEPIEAPIQERALITSGFTPNPRGTKSKARSARRRANKRKLKASE